MRNPEKKQYRKPEVQDWGTVRDLTATGGTTPGSDAKQGSVDSQGV
ncbi:MAG TPA: lasso RiPP family leader peptide-containing protein [Longimicrobiales bacterium]|nr:lasso RiPP family leader peptide-containing protein [Longimicrobiales bacterium]